MLSINMKLKFVSMQKKPFLIKYLMIFPFETVNYFAKNKNAEIFQFKQEETFEKIKNFGAIKKKLFLKILQYSQEYTCVGVFFN